MQAGKVVEKIVPVVVTVPTSQLLTAILLTCLVIPIVFVSLNLKDSSNADTNRQRNIATVVLLGVALAAFVLLWWNTA